MEVEHGEEGPLTEENDCNVVIRTNLEYNGSQNCTKQSYQKEESRGEQVELMVTERVKRE